MELGSRGGTALSFCSHVRATVKHVVVQAALRVLGRKFAPATRYWASDGQPRLHDRGGIGGGMRIGGRHMCREFGHLHSRGRRCSVVRFKALGASSTLFGHKGALHSEGTESIRGGRATSSLESEDQFFGRES
jgi:hypothetical protein